MSETTENQIEELVEDQPTEEGNTKELTPEEILNDLRNQRTGMFDVELAYTDASYLRNLLDRAEYKGPQQAYLLIISKLEISQICESLKEFNKEEKKKVKLTSASIESISFFMNNAVGKGAATAQKLFAASMVLRPAVARINEIDQQMSIIQKGLESESK